ncbi:MAG: glycosyltransferase family 39 protein, partial [Chloroflexota bacterium]
MTVQQTPLSQPAASTRSKTDATITPVQTARFTAAVSMALVSIYCAFLPMMKFRGLGYRGDEAWTLWHAMNSPRRVLELLTLDIKPPMYFFVLGGWVQLFGHHETITRYLSALFLILALAFCYQIGRVLFNRAAGVWTALLVGLLPVAQHYVHEMNTYTSLMLGVTATSAFLLLWLRTGKGHYAVAYVAAGIFVAYSHYYGVITIIAQAGWALLFVRWRNWTLVRAFSLFAAVGLAFALGWGGVVLYTVSGGNVGGGGQFIVGTPFEVLSTLYIEFQSRPTGLLVMAFLFGLITVGSTAPAESAERLRWSNAWRRGFPLAMIVLVVGLGLALNAVSPTLNARNLIVLAPFLCVIAAYGMVNLPRRLQAVTAVLLI